MDKYILRYLILGQLIMVGLFAWVAVPSDGATYTMAILQTVGLFAAIDVVGLAVGYYVRQMDEHITITGFLKGVW